MSEIERYPVETLSDYEDDGTMPRNVQELADAVIGRRIVAASKERLNRSWGHEEVMVITLDDGRRVTLKDDGDCCAYTALDGFFLDPASVDHIILGVGTTDAYSTWHIYADFGDVMQMQVGWSSGNTGYYGYGFAIDVQEIDADG